MIKNFLVAAFLLLASLGTSSAQFADQATYAGSGAGTANAQTLTLPNAASLTDLLGVLIKYTPGATNTGDTTLQINGFASPPHVRKATTSGLVTLTGNELVNGVPVALMWNGTYFVIMSASTATLPSLTPQGYLTPCNFANSPSVSGCSAGSVVPTGDVTAATTLYYQPAFGDGVPIWNGSNFVNFIFSELTLTIPSSRLADTIYDVCIFNNAGTPTIAFGPAWTTSTAGSGSRGTGAGTAEITLTQGIWTNAVSISGVNGASTFTIAANQCTTVATVIIDGTNGQVTFHRTWGQSRKWAAWNFYNRLPLYLKAGDSTATWSYNNATIRASNGSSANSLRVLSGLPQETYDFNFQQNVGVNAASATYAIYIGYNSTTAGSGLTGLISTGGGSGIQAQMYARYLAPGATGAQVITSLENNATANTGNPGAQIGTEAFMILSAKWRG